ncbi:hypothetical protein [Phenylobacterium sp.]|uniref:hypothetical protein n=1 Tax=Phenylobacterium sp. TaxID=1871053 RepID=UPI0035AE15EB
MAKTDPKPWKPPVWAPATFVAAASLAAAAGLGLHPQDPHEAAAVFPFWWGQGRSVEAAAQAGDIVAVGAAPFVVVARSDTQDIAAALKAQGAWLVIDPGLAVGCGA